MTDNNRVVKKRTDTPSRESDKGGVYQDPLKETSDRSGISGFLETFLRKFRNIGFFVFLAPIVLVYVICLGAAFSPGVYIVQSVNKWSENYHVFFQALSLGLAIALGVIFFWITMILIVPLFNFPLLYFVKPTKSTWYSLNIIPWYYHNALVQLARYTTLDFMAPTYFNLYFYRMMGMKIGKGVVINTSNISDPCLIELGDYVTIGGSATLFAHYGMKGFLIVSKLKIEEKTTIGLKASVMGDVEIGKRVMVTPHTVIMPKSRIEDDAIVGL